MSKTCFSAHNTHSSVDFTWFALLSHQKLITDLCSSLQHFVWWSLSFARLIPNNVEFTFMQKNHLFLFFKKSHIYWLILVYIYIVFANGPGDLGSIPGRVIPKTLKMELDTTLLNTQHYKVRFKSKVEQSWEWSNALPYTLV